MFLLLMADQKFLKNSGPTLEKIYAQLGRSVYVAPFVLLDQFTLKQLGQALYLLIISKITGLHYAGLILWPCGN
jgi:hypothetical protein